MYTETLNPIVAKFGGTSTAHPEVVLAQLEHEDNQASVVVVSAPGIDDAFPVKATDMLLGYRTGAYKADAIQERYAALLKPSGMEGDSRSLEIVENIPQDLQRWRAACDPAEALGEYWIARLFAVQSGRTFVDARDAILLNDDGTVDEQSSIAALRSRTGDGGKYVLPGFYGLKPDYSIGVLPRGYSDFTGALAAKALGATFHNWSDVPGFMTADPRKVADAQLLDRVTYREARELGNGGSELLHRSVIKLLGGTGIKTVMRQTFGELGNVGTEIVDDRAWQWRSIIGVTGRDDLLVLSQHEFGLNEGVGQTLDVIQALKSRGIPYEHSNDATDDISIYLNRQYKDEVEAIATKLRRPGRTFRTSSAGLIYVVGEGLAQSGTVRLAALGAVATALANDGIEGRGASDVGGSATLTLFVNPKSVTRAINLAHQALDLGKAPRTRY